MNTQTYIARITHPKTLAGRLRTGCTTSLLPLLLLALPTVVQAQFTYSTTNGTLTITAYTGPGGDVVIPDTLDGLPVTSIGARAFYSTSVGVTSVTIPNSVTNIGDFAFYACQYMTNVTIGNGVASIGQHAFDTCSLNSITIPNSVTSIGDSAFQNCMDLTSVTIPNSVTSIGSGVFDCMRLTAITVDPLNACYSSMDAVLFNKSQTTLVECPEAKVGNYIIPGSVTNIGDYAFFGCSRLTSITIPNSVISIGDSGFLSCWDLTNVTIGNSVTSIGSQAFGECSGLTSVTIPNSVTTIGSGAFGGCDGLTSVTIPDSVTNIAAGAFSYCGLTSVTIPDSVTSIGANAFQNCYHLTSVTIPSSVTSIGDSAFDSCYSLTSVAIGTKVTCIGVGAFYHCDSLTSLTLPASVTNIESNAFSFCGNLTRVFFQGNAPSLGQNVFVGVLPFPPHELVPDPVTVYYLPGTTGWDTTFGNRPTAQWFLPNPLILDFGPSFGVQTNGFGFVISWATNLPVVVEASTSLANPNWSPLATNTLTSGSSYFSDPQWTNHPTRFYRLRSP